MKCDFFNCEFIVMLDKVWNGRSIRNVSGTFKRPRDKFSALELQVASYNSLTSCMKLSNGVVLTWQ